jgi:transposase InsO family protein
VKFAWIQEHRQAFGIKAMCQVLEVSPSGFYAWCGRPISERQKRRSELARRIKAAHQNSRGVYGSPRVYRVLEAQGQQVCENTVARIMRLEQIRARIKRRFVPRTTDSAHDHRPAPNRLDRCFEADRPNHKWVADITYVATEEGWLYVAAVMDLYSRRIVGWSMADHLKAELVSNALLMALARRSPEAGLLHHSDRGVQYACDDYQELLARHGIACSMSGRGNCYDNAVMESFWATLKTELVYLANYATRQQAQASIFEYIEVFYNRIRLHSSIGYVSPESFEASLN